jgi:hypothetical protein
VWPVDEVNALVIDVGSSWTKAGYAGEDGPKAVFPTYVGCRDAPDSEPAPQVAGGDYMEVDSAAKRKRIYNAGDASLLTWRDGMEIQNPIKNGLGMYQRALLVQISYGLIKTRLVFCVRGCGWMPRSMPGPCARMPAAYNYTLKGSVR